jgi:hypothetical protein
MTHINIAKRFFKNRDIDIDVIKKDDEIDFVSTLISWGRDNMSAANFIIWRAHVGAALDYTSGSRNTEATLTNEYFEIRYKKVCAGETNPRLYLGGVGVSVADTYKSEWRHPEEILDMRDGVHVTENFGYVIFRFY